MRGKPEKFAEHYNQATLFWNSQSDVEKAHIVERVPLRAHEGADGRRARAHGRGLAQRRGRARASASPTASASQLPEPLPKVLGARAASPRSKSSPALSLLARPGDGGIATRRIAILVADGVDGEPLRRCTRRSTQRGAVPRFVGAKLGAVESASGEPIEVEISLEAGPVGAVRRASCCRTARTPSTTLATARARDGVHQGSVPALQADPRARRVERVARGRRHLRHAAVGRKRPRRARCARKATSRKPLAAFVEALARHRHFERETLPPRV